jgi:hypothetical protein
MKHVSLGGLDVSRLGLRAPHRPLRSGRTAGPTALEILEVQRAWAMAAG